MKNNVNNLTDEKFKELWNKSYNMTYFLTSIPVSTTGTHNRIIARERASLLGLNEDHWVSKNSVRYTNEDIFVENSGAAQDSVKKRYEKIESKDYCRICKLSKWLDEDIPLCLDHINGISNDNRIENLRWICFNCHAKTETFCGRKKNLFNIKKE